MKFKIVLVMVVLATISGCKSCVSSTPCGKKVCIGGGVK